MKAKISITPGFCASPFDASARHYRSSAKKFRVQLAASSITYGRTEENSARHLLLGGLDTSHLNKTQIIEVMEPFEFSDGVRLAWVTWLIGTDIERQCIGVRVKFLKRPIAGRRQELPADWNEWTREEPARLPRRVQRRGRGVGDARDRAGTGRQIVSLTSWHKIALLMETWRTSVRRNEMTYWERRNYHDAVRDEQDRDYEAETGRRAEVDE